MALTRNDPYSGYNFAVEIDGITSAGFKTCSGLDVTIATVPYREGTDASLAPRQVPGSVSYASVVLSRGVTTDPSLWQWHDAIVKGTVSRRNASIVLRDNLGNEKIRWNLANCWPTKWSGPSFDASSDAIAIETLELTHEGIEVQKWS
jgi:phage tail-like protein